MPGLWIRRLQFAVYANSWGGCTLRRLHSAKKNNRGYKFLSETSEMVGINCGFQLFTLHSWWVMADAAPYHTYPNTTFVSKLQNYSEPGQEPSIQLLFKLLLVHDLSIVNGISNVKHLSYRKIAKIPAVNRMSPERHSCLNHWNLWTHNIRNFADILKFMNLKQEKLFTLTNLMRLMWSCKTLKSELFPTEIGEMQQKTLIREIRSMRRTHWICPY